MVSSMTRGNSKVTKTKVRALFVSNGEIIDNSALELDLAEKKRELHDAKINRKLADSDAQMLANRLLLLKAEMSKAQRKIEETKARTAFIQSVQRDSAKRMRRRQLDEAEQHEHDSNDSRGRKSNLRTQDKCTTKRQTQSTSLLQRKKEDAVQIKAERKANMERIRHEKEIARRQAIEARRVVQMQHEAVRKTREAQQKKKLEAVRRQIEERIAIEREEATAKQAEIDRMEREELALIAKLQRKQLQQKDAYVQLEAVLTHPSLDPGKIA